MEFVAATLGIQLPVRSARRAVMECFSSRQRILSTVEGIVSAHRDSFVLVKGKFLHQHSLDDDSTASLSASSFDDDSSDSSNHCALSVSFANPVVTHVYLRPLTTSVEKERLFYNEHDFREFRMEYLGYRPARNRLVKFSETVVSEVRTFPALEDKDKLYYSETELQT